MINNIFADDIDTITKQIQNFRENGLKIFSTSSFQTNSVVLLHILSRVDYSIPIYFLNTGYHFPETLIFKSDLKRKLNINVIDVFSDIPKNQQRDAKGNLMYTSDPDYCCYMNKVRPLEDVKTNFNVWISGIRGVQNENRANKKMIEKNDNELIRYHPLLDWSNKKVYEYIKYNELPTHPLEEEGYLSIGCEPCTSKAIEETFDESLSRNGRWSGLNKTECGIHT